MAKYQIEYLPLALDDLDDIFTYIAEDDPGAATALLNEIDTAIFHLASFPEMGINPRLTRLSKKGYKILIVRDYLVFYVLIDDIVEIRHK